MVHTGYSIGKYSCHNSPQKKKKKKRCEQTQHDCPLPPLKLMSGIYVVLCPVHRTMSPLLALMADESIQSYPKTAYRLPNCKLRAAVLLKNDSVSLPAGTHARKKFCSRHRMMVPYTDSYELAEARRLNEKKHPHMRTLPHAGSCGSQLWRKETKSGKARISLLQ